jgi:Arc/MetJ family transcription regulator
VQFVDVTGPLSTFALRAPVDKSRLRRRGALGWPASRSSRSRLDRYTRIGDSYTWRRELRTNIDIDDELMREAMRASGERTKRAVVERALRLLVQTRGQARIRRLRGKVTWRGDLNESRRARGAAGA